MRPSGTTRDDEAARHANLIRLLARRPPIRRLQRALESVADLWSGPDFLHWCLGGYVHWRVTPSADEIAIVASHHADARIPVRRAVFAALFRTGARAVEATAALRLGLEDADAQVRLLAARGVSGANHLGAFDDALLRRLDDGVWTVRWYAARGLAAGAHRERAHAVLLASRPVSESLSLDVWRECARSFEDSSPSR